MTPAGWRRSPGGGTARAHSAMLGARPQLDVSSLLGGQQGGGTRPLCRETSQELPRQWHRELKTLKTGVFSPVGVGIWGLNVLEQRGSLSQALPGRK